MDVFAADLWEVYKNRGSEEYTDPDTFFKKTHVTPNLEDILKGVKKRLSGKGGDGFQHIETPFGGGKTHMLIGLYHSARKWDAKTVVIVGTAMSSKDTVWEMMEEQLDGKVDMMKGKLAPGREIIRNLLEKHGSVMILIDELIPYMITASGVKVEQTTLAAQTITFIQQLSEEVATLKQVCVVASFPGSTIEFNDIKAAEELLNIVRKVSSRKERKVTPINPHDVPNIIRSRLFSTSEKDIGKHAKKTIEEFVEYCDKESILPSGMTPKQYKEEFERTYPFLPQVINILYTNWGSFGTFQRTRGVLRLLSLVVYSLKDSDNPYITLADFDLQDGEIRRELLDHIGNEYDSVIEKDITSNNSGSLRAGQDLGSAYRGLHLGTRTATAIFMSSFSNGGKNGAVMNDIKRAVAIPGVPSAIVDGLVIGFKNRLSYIKSEDERHLFTNEPNMYRLKLDKMEGIGDDEVREFEKHLLVTEMGGKLRPRIWPNHKDVDDSPELKLVILPSDDSDKCNEILEKKGGVPRIYRNSVLFLCPLGSERGQFVESIKSVIALKKILGSDISLNPNQKKDLIDSLKREESDLTHLIQKYYRTLYVPDQTGITKIDMGIPIIGALGGISDHVYETLISEQQIHEEIGPKTLEGTHLKTIKFINTSTLYESMLKIRGNRRPVGRNVIEAAIKHGVSQGIFGLGRVNSNDPVCTHFKEDNILIEFSDDEILIHSSLCTKMKSPEPDPEISSIESNNHSTLHSKDTNALNFDVQVPEGKMIDFVRALMLVNTRFRTIEFKVCAKDGTIADTDIEKLREALNQMGASNNL